MKKEEMLCATCLKSRDSETDDPSARICCANANQQPVTPFRYCGDGLWEEEFVWYETGVKPIRVLRRWGEWIAS
jgi:hypothetical protein